MKCDHIPQERKQNHLASESQPSRKLSDSNLEGKREFQGAKMFSKKQITHMCFVANQALGRVNKENKILDKNFLGETAADISDLSVVRSWIHKLKG